MLSGDKIREIRLTKPNFVWNHFQHSIPTTKSQMGFGQLSKANISSQPNEHKGPKQHHKFKQILPF